MWKWIINEDAYNKIKKIRKNLKDARNKENKDPNFVALIEFAQNKKNIVGKELERKQTTEGIHKFIKVLNAVGKRELSLLGDNDLDKYIEALEKQLELAKAYRVLKKYK